MDSTGAAARMAAVDLLDQVLGHQRMLSECAGSLDALAPADRARAQRLAAETLRGLERADRILAKHLQRPPPLTIRNLLRLGTVELCHGEAAHGVVNTCVNIAAGHRRLSKFKGLVNAVLRKVAADGPARWASLRVPRVPKWLRGRLVEAWGAEATARIEAAHFAGAPLDLTLNPQHKDFAGIPDAHALPTGSVRLHTPSQVSALPGYTDGAWWVQDAAAALAARALAATAGESVLDLCAAPGGKTLQLAATGAQVAAVDISEERLDLLRANLARTGLEASVLTADVFHVTGSHDAILLDAPCSATGTIRRHPDLPHVRGGERLPDLVDLQKRMVDHAWTLLRPGGRLVFCTCSLLPEEGEAQIVSALQRHDDMHLDLDALKLPGVDPGWVDQTCGLRVRPDYWPETGGMDGFFIAALGKAK